MAIRYYKVAEHTFTVCMADNEKGIALPSYEPFAVSADGVDELLFALEVDDAFYPLAKGELIGEFDCGAADFGVYRLNDGTYQMLISPPGGQYCGLLQASPDFKEAVIATRGEDSLRTFAVNNALMLMFAFASAGMGTLLVHASVIKNDDRGYLFLGKSGTGKSTHSDLWLRYIKGSELLNDDNPVVRVNGKEVMVYGSPWSGKTPCYKDVGYPIGGIVRLEQAPVNEFQRLDGVQAFIALMPGCAVIKQDKRLYAALCDRLAWLAEQVTVGKMACRPDREAAVVCGNGFRV